MQCNAVARSLTAFTNGFSISTASKATHISSFLAPSATNRACIPTTLQRCQIRKFCQRRTFTSRSKLLQQTEQSTENTNPVQDPPLLSSKQRDFDGNETAISRKRDRKRIAVQEKYASLITQLDPYLPLELRSKTWLENLTDFQGVRGAETLPAILLQCKEQMPSQPNLLTHIAIDQGRWDAFLSLVNALLTLKPSERSKQNITADLLSQSPWGRPSSIPFSFEDITTDSINFQTEQTQQTSQSLEPLDQYVDSYVSDDATNRYRDAIGEIWECLGDILIHTSTLKATEQQTILPYVHRVLGEMHSVDAIPASIYQYDSPKVPSSHRKPPYLHAMTSRIMAVISDSMWHAIEHDTLKNSALDALTYAHKGHEMPGARLNPRVRQLGVNVWFELVLWACVHDAYPQIASRLLDRVSRIKGQCRWSMVSWNEVEHAAEQKAVEKKESHKSKSWFVKLASAIEGYSEEPSLFEMPANSISKEVVLALCDTATATSHGDSRMQSIDLIAISYASLAQNSSKFQDGPNYNSILLRLNLGQHANSAVPERLLKLSHVSDEIDGSARSLEKQFGESNQVHQIQKMEMEFSPETVYVPHTELEQFQRYYTKSNFLEDFPNTTRSHSKLSDIPSNTNLNTEFALEIANPWKSILLSSLIHAIDKKKLKEALLRLNQLQNVVDRERLIYMYTSEKLGFDELDDAAARSQQTTMQVPHSTLAALLDVVREARMLDLAYWLLYSEDADGSLIPSNAHCLPIFQPSLLRFAAATSDFRLITKITRQLSASLTQFSDEILESLLDAYTKIKKFKNAAEVLTYMCDDRRIIMKEQQIINLVCAHIRLDNQSRQFPELKPLEKLLSSIFKREFIPPHDPSKRIDLRPWRVINQICRICSGLPGKIPDLAFPGITSVGPASVSTSIDADAFNTLLKTVKDVHGPGKARDLVIAWCHHSTEDDDSKFTRYKIKDNITIPFQASESKEHKVVKPNFETMRILLEDVLDQKTEAKPMEQASSNSTIRRLLEVEQNGDKADQHESEAPNPPTSVISDAEFIDWGLKMCRRMSLKDDDIQSLVSNTTLNDE